MTVFSEPGTVEFLPMMPDYLMQGSIDGVWLYTFAKLNHMDWDEKGIRASITSNQDQTLTLRNRQKGCRILVSLSMARICPRKATTYSTRSRPTRLHRLKSSSKERILYAKLK